MKKLLSLLLIAVLALSVCACSAAETADTSALKITAPGGAPALALATLAAENPDQYTFVAAETIAAAFADKAADFIIAPINAGAKLYKAGKSAYKLAAVVSWGNLYFASQKADFALDDMNGAEIVLFGENTVNASIALYALAENGIVPGEVTYKASAANTQQVLLTDETAIVLTAEPALTAARMKNERVTAYSLNELYKNATGNDGFPQAGLFVKAELIENQPEAVDAYLKLAAESCARCESDAQAVADAAVALEILPNVKVALSAIPGCAIRYLPAGEAKAQIETTVAVDPAPYGGAAPADDFYYGAK